jgi:hypothetical protein
MKVCPLIAVLLFASACAGPADAQQETPADIALKEGARKTSTNPEVNPDAAAMAEFKTKVEAYADLHRNLAKGVARHRETSDPAEITKATQALAAKIQTARVNAKYGDIFTETVRPVFRRLLAPELKGPDGKDVKAVLKDDAPAPGTVPFKVNAKYPEGQPRPTVPVNLLVTLPTLPEPLEYRIVGQHLLLIDTDADLIVDYILNVIPI